MKLFTIAQTGHIGKQTKLYSGHHSRNVHLNKQGILRFIGGIILSGYCPIYDKRGLWSADEII